MSMQHAQLCVTIYSTSGKFDQFQILWSYTLLLKLPVLMRSCLSTCIISKHKGGGRVRQPAWARLEALPPSSSPKPLHYPGLWGEAQRSGAASPALLPHNPGLAHVTT